MVEEPRDCQQELRKEENILQVFCRPQCGLEAVWHVDFLKNVVYMCLHRVGAYAQVIGDVLVLGAAYDHGQYFQLPLGENDNILLVIAIAVFSGEDVLGHDIPRVPHLPLEHRCNTLHNLLGRVLFVEKALDPP